QRKARLRTKSLASLDQRPIKCNGEKLQRRIQDGKIRVTRIIRVQEQGPDDAARAIRSIGKPAPSGMRAHARRLGAVKKVALLAEILPEDAVRIGIVLIHADCRVLENGPIRLRHVTALDRATDELDKIAGRKLPLTRPASLQCGRVVVVNCWRKENAR